VHRIRIQSFVVAPRAEVWSALVERAEVVLDALPEARWPEPHAAEAPARLTAPWPHTAAVGAATEVVVTLEDLEGGTRVDLEHRGLGEGPAWEEAIGGYFAGWLQSLAALGVLVESGVDARCSPERRGRERYFASGEIPAVADAVWRALTDPYVAERWSDGVLDGAETLESHEGRFLRLVRRPAALTSGISVDGALGGEVPAPAELTLILRRTPRGTHLALAEYGVTGRAASSCWPPLFERLTRYLI
jgi:uncharacterized protein YndB with AHSA1/START domain